MNRILSVLAIFLSSWVHSAIADTKPVVRIYVKNTSQIERKNEVIEVKFSRLSSKIIDKPFKIIESVSQQEVPYQLEYRGMEKPQNLLLQIKALKPGRELIFEVTSGAPVQTEAKTFARYVPERKDDFAWENDKIAFRMYGKALETASDNAFGTDIWSKKTDKLVINKWYQKGDYHKDNGEGMDFYTVGLTLGAGDIAPYVNDSIFFSNNYHRYKVLDNGPLRSTFQLVYDSWKAGNLTISTTKTISLSAGSQLNRVEVNYRIEGADKTEAVIGISKRKLPGSILLEEKNGVMGYWEPEIPGKGIIGVGVILNENAMEMKVEQGHLLSRVAIENSTPLVYYNGGAWDGAGIIKTDSDWFKYLKDYKYCLNTPLEIQVR